MLREAWNLSRPSGDTFIEQTITTTTTTTTTSRRRLPSAPEARLRRLFLSTPTAHATRPLSSPAMCSDSVIVPGDAGTVTMSSFKPPCYCHNHQEHHDQMQQHFEFTCKLNFEDLNYNYNYIENEYYLPARVVPRFSSLPRTMSMLANTSHSTSSSDNEEECHSLADSLEDLSRINSRASFDDKPVRGDAAPTHMSHSKPIKEVPKAEKFFVGLSEPIDNFGLQLPAFLKEKLDKRKQELEQKKPKNLEPLPTHRSRTPKSNRRVAINKSFRQFESIPEENSDTNTRIRLARNRVLARNLQPRFQMGHSQRALQGIVQESKDLSIIASDGTEAIQTVVPLPVPANKSKQTERDLAAMNPGWGNFYLIKGPEDATRDKENTKGDSPKAKSRKKWTKIETSSSEERVTTTVRMQNPKSHQIRQQRATTSVTRSSVVLPRISSDGRNSAKSEGSRPAPNMQRHPPVPAIKPKTHETTSSIPLALPNLQSPTKKEPINTKTFTRSKSSKSARTSPQESPSKPKMVVARQNHNKSDIEPGTIVAEAETSESGTWSVTLSGLYPQPEMELRLLFPPTEEGADPKDLKNSKGDKGDKGGSPKKLNDKRTPSPMNENNSVDYILTFKNNKQANNRPSSAGSNKSRSRPSSAGSPSKTKALVPVSKALVPKSPEGQIIVANSSEEMLMWPEMQSLLQEQMTRHVKKQVTTVTTSETTTTEGAIMVQRLRGGEGANEAITHPSGVQPVLTKNMAVATQRRKRASS